MAVQIVATMLSNAIETSLSPERRRLVLDQLRHINEIEGSPEEDALMARIAWAETIAHRWIQQAKVPEQAHGFLLSEIVGGLDGQLADERHQRRMSQLIDDALLPLAACRQI